MKSSLPGGTGRLIALLSIFAVIPLILLVALPLQMATNSLGKEATSRVADTAAVSSNAISLQMSSLSGLAQSFSARPELWAKTSIPTTSVSNPAVETLSQLKAANPNVRAASLLNADGKWVVGVGTTGLTPGTDLSFRDYFKGAVNNSSAYVGGAIVAIADNKPKIVTVSKAIRGPANTKGVEPLEGVLVISVDVTQTFQSYVNTFKAQSGVSTSIIDQNNVIVAAPGLTAEVPTTIDSRVDRARTGESTSAKLTQNKQHVIVAYSPIQGTDWVLTTSVPQKAAYAPVNEFRARVFIIALILGTVIAAAFGC